MTFPSELNDLSHETPDGDPEQETAPTGNGNASFAAQNGSAPPTGDAEVIECARRWATLKRQADELTHTRIEADEDLRLAACDDLDAANDDYEMGLHAVDEEEIPMGFVGEPCGSAKASAKDADRQFRMARLRYNRFRERSMRFDVWTERACREAHEAKQALLAAAEALPPAEDPPAEDPPTEDPPTDSTAGNGSQG